MDFDEFKKQYFNSLKGKRKGKKVGRPNFKKRSNRESFRIPGQRFNASFCKGMDVCQKCNAIHDRDLNAAINIKNQGQIDCYNNTLVATTKEEVLLPTGLMKFVAKTERPRAEALVDKGMDKILPNMENN